jgi:hypothetical protein
MNSDWDCWIQTQNCLYWKSAQDVLVDRRPWIWALWANSWTKNQRQARAPRQYNFFWSYGHEPHQLIMVLWANSWTRNQRPCVSGISFFLLFFFPVI